jgi:hypothetical protein
MPCPKAPKGEPHAHIINERLQHPNTHVSRNSKILRAHLDRHGYVTPNFTWREMGDTGGAPVPPALRPNTIRHCWSLEHFAHMLAAHAKHGHPAHGHKRIPISVDGPYRTESHNRAIGGAPLSQHVQADASDHFVAQVNLWEHLTGLTKMEIVEIAYTVFPGVGNETSGTLHLDSRPGRPGEFRFVTWTHSS